MDTGKRELLLVALASLSLLALANLPYLQAFMPGSGLEFGGALLAVPDGYSYLAKMQLGASGAWLYTLRFTTDPGPGVVLFTFYLALGHLSRWTGIGVLPLYHLARLACSGFFLLTAYHVIRPLAPTVPGRFLRWALFILASGLGWLATPLTGTLSPDLWVAESIPFLSLIANPHFALAWALLLWLMYTALPAWSGPAVPGRAWRVAGLSLALAEVYPMALPAALGALGVAWLWNRWRRRPGGWAELAPVLAAGLAAAPRLLYTAWIVKTHPQLALWNAQNLSPAPEWPWALVWGGLPLLLAALAGGWSLRARPVADLNRFWLLWIVIGVAAVYAPYELQRRLSLGLMFPIAMLAASAWERLLGPQRVSRWVTPARAALALLLGLSNLLVWVGAWAAASNHDPALFLLSTEARAIAALPADAVVLAAPDLGGFIPTRSLARVVYGHAAETPNAEALRQTVVDFYEGRVSARSVLDRFAVTRVFYGPREAELGPLPDLPTGWSLLSDDDGLQVYAREATP